MSSRFQTLPDTTVDQIMIANQQWPAFQKEHRGAVNTTIGVLIDPLTAKPWQPKVVSEARVAAMADINASHSYGYQTQAGHEDYLHEAGKFVFGTALHDQIKDRILAYQSLGGTGALSLAKETLLDLMHGPTTADIPLVLDQGWPNHPAIFSAPFSIVTYPHLNENDAQYNHQAAIAAFSTAPRSAIFLLQTCGYNDDGADRKPKEWDEIYDIAEQKSAIVILDSAYLGLANGIKQDRYPIEQSIKRGLLTLVCVSFSKSMGCYNERLGALFIVNADEQMSQEQYRRLDQLVMRITRRTISNPPRLAAQAAASVLRDPTYLGELETARASVMHNRKIFAEQLRAFAPAVIDGRGLFTKLLPHGFTAKQKAFLSREGILVLQNSRFNLGGIQANQLERVGAAVQHALGL